LKASQNLGRKRAAKRVSINESEYSWGDAREFAYSLGEMCAIESAPIDSGDRRVCAEDLVALTDLPNGDSSSMDGWAVSGVGPWTVNRADHIELDHARPITTGAALPAGAQAIVRTENGTLTGARLESASASAQDIRRAGEECARGDLLCRQGTALHPALIGLLAATGHDAINVVTQPTVQIIITGDELLTSGLPRQKFVRDSLGPQLPLWLTRMGAQVLPVLYITDHLDQISHAISTTKADLVVTTGGTAASTKDHFQAAIELAQGQVLVDGVAVRPGHPMKLAVSQDRKYPIIGLPGNPLAAVVALITLAQPIISKMLGQQLPVGMSIPTSQSLKGGKSGSRLAPGTIENQEFVPALYSGSAMLRGLSTSTGFAIVTAPVDAGSTIEFLPLPG
jgi:molybdopterin molybdotransferase